MKPFSLLAIIPARAGSIGLPGKNTLLLGGKPLINWTIDSIDDVNLIDKKIVSTNDPKIIDICKMKKIPFQIRPEQLSADDSTAYDVIKFSLGEELNWTHVIYLQPTSPLRTKSSIVRAIKAIKDNSNELDGLVSIRKTNEMPEWMYRQEKSGLISPILKDQKIRRQINRQSYILNGAIYIFKVEKYLQVQGDLNEMKLLGFEMNSKESIDIDTLEDFNLAKKSIFQ